MSPLRSSNLDRAAYRVKCREKLSEHIGRLTLRSKGCLLITCKVIKLGITIEPGEVRLITTADDLYAWRSLPEKIYLFNKQMSKHSVGAYRELCREVGVSFEAVLTPTSDHVVQEEEASAKVCDCSIARNLLTKLKEILMCREQFRLRD